MKSTLSLAAVVLAVAAGPIAAQRQSIPFGPERWQVLDGQVVEHLGRPAFAGTAVLKDLEFRNGVIEVDVAVSGERSYPGVLWRVQSLADYERFYIRPHREGLYPDALQYTPVINRIAGWQLYNGEGFTAGSDIPAAEWIPLRIEVHGTQARVFLGDMADPGLVIANLQHGESVGSVGVMGPTDGTAYFSNFRYRATDDLAFAPPPEPSAPTAGTIADWSLSRVYPAERVPRDRYPRFYSIFLAQWQPVSADHTGLVDIARHAPRANQAGDLVMARTAFRSDEARDVVLSFGYSDDVDLFVNGRKVFHGSSGYRSRDPSFLGIVGLHDEVPVRFERGLNEIMLMVTERFGGWGFMMRADPPLEPKVRGHHRLTKAWETDQVFLTPESVQYDPDRRVLYVTSFDNQYAQRTERTGYISKLSLDGAVLDREWVSGLHAPTGMAIWDDHLYVTERDSLVAIDLGSGRITNRWEIPDADFPNDVAVDSRGYLYISDTRPSDWNESRIYRFRDGAFEVWANEGISRANGLCVADDWLIVGNSGDGFLTRVRLSDTRVERITSLGAGIIDGIRVTPDGNYLVSHWEGQTYAITADGAVVEVLDLLPEGRNAADFEYLPEQGLLVIPTFLDNRVVAYHVN